jgi:4-diphosphocytidyl-2-C-methyl-D-erythritol kinase
LVSFPTCKINLGLNILRKREDGFHDIETVFYPIPLRDALEIVTLPSGTANQFNQTGIEIPGSLEDNICIKAWELLKSDFPELPFVSIHLHKVIPVGAGLGGGSSDGAFMLVLLNRKYNLGMNDARLLEYALKLGSDCPFFIKNQPAFASGRGEVLQPLDLNLSGYKFVIVNPGIHISTAWAFSSIAPKQPSENIHDIIRLPPSQWRNRLKNDFEELVEKQHPEIPAIRKALYEKGAVYAAMSGSGSTVFGIFEKEKEVVFDFPVSYFVSYIQAHV